MYFKWAYAKKKYGKDVQLSIERIDVNGNYDFNNCIFIPKNEQQKNQRKNKWFKAISPNGEEFISNNQSEFARQYKLHQGTISLCLNGFINDVDGWFFNFIKITNIKKYKLEKKEYCYGL